MGVLFQYPIYGSRRVAKIEVQQAAEPLASADATIDGRRHGGREGDDVAEALMIALGMVVGDKLRDDRSQVTLAQGDDVSKAFLPDRPNEPLA